MKASEEGTLSRVSRFLTLTITATSKRWKRIKKGEVGALGSLPKSIAAHALQYLNGKDVGAFAVTCDKGKDLVKRIEREARLCALHGKH